MPTIAEQLAALPVTDTLQHEITPEDWVKWPWSSSMGWVEATGWRPETWSEGFVAGSKAGWYWSPAKVKGGNGATILRRSNSFGHINLRQFSVWLFSAGGESASGYQLVAWQTGTVDSYTFKLRRWVEGGEKLLAETPAVAMGATGSFAIVSLSGKVSAWVRQNEATGWALVGSEVSDATFTEGYSGVDGNGSNPTLVNFATGVMSPVGGSAPRVPRRALLGVGR